MGILVIYDQEGETDLREAVHRGARDLDLAASFHFALRRPLDIVGNAGERLDYFSGHSRTGSATTALPSP